MKTRKYWAVAPLALAGVCALVFVRHEPSSRRATAPAVATEPTGETTPVVSPPLADTASVEDSLMQRLHELGERDPTASLELAVAGNTRFPASPGAAERGWIICKSLANLRRFDEAVAEARIVVEAYPNTPWALDVAHHLLLNPLTDSSERGYGQRAELE